MRLWPSEEQDRRQHDHHRVPLRRCQRRAGVVWLSPTVNLLEGSGLDEIYSRADSTGTKSFLRDALGSTLALADASGSVSTSYTYEPSATRPRLERRARTASSTPAARTTGRGSTTCGLATTAQGYSGSCPRIRSASAAGTSTSTRTSTTSRSPSSIGLVCVAPAWEASSMTDWALRLLEPDQEVHPRGRSLRGRVSEAGCPWSNWRPRGLRCQLRCRGI